jgi:hypothetical protein
LIYRNETGDWFVTISQNSIGNAITELLVVAVNRIPDGDAYARTEPRLIEHLLRVRERLIDIDLGDPISTDSWPRSLWRCKSRTWPDNVSRGFNY